MSAVADRAPRNDPRKTNTHNHVAEFPSFPAPSVSRVEGAGAQLTSLQVACASLLAQQRSGGLVSVEAEEAARVQSSLPFFAAPVRMPPPPPPPASVASAAPSGATAEPANGGGPATVPAPAASANSTSGGSAGTMRSQLRADAMEFRPASSTSAGLKGGLVAGSGAVSLVAGAQLGLVHHPGGGGTPSSPTSACGSGALSSVNNGASAASPTFASNSAAPYHSTHQFNRNAQEFVPGRPFMVFPSSAHAAAGAPPPPALASALSGAAPQGAVALSRAGASGAPAAGVAATSAAASVGGPAVVPGAIRSGSPSAGAPAPSMAPAFSPPVVGARGAGAAHMGPGGPAGQLPQQSFVPVPAALHFAPIPHHPGAAPFAGPVPNGALYAGPAPGGPVDHLVAVPPADPATLAAQLPHDPTAAGAFVYPAYGTSHHGHPLVGPPPGAGPAGGEFLGVGPPPPYAVGGPSQGPAGGRGGRGGRMGRGGRGGGDVSYRGGGGGVGRGAGRGMGPGGHHHGGRASNAGQSAAGATSSGTATWVPGPQAAQQTGAQATSAPSAGGKPTQPHAGAATAGCPKAGATTEETAKTQQEPPPPTASSEASEGVAAAATRAPAAGTSFRDKLLQGNAKIAETPAGAGAAGPGAVSASSVSQAKQGSTGAGAQERGSPSSPDTTTGAGTGAGTVVGGGVSPSGSSTNDGARSPVSGGTVARTSSADSPKAAASSAGGAASPATTGNLSYAGAAAAAALNRGNGAATGSQSSPRTTAVAAAAAGARASSAPQKGLAEDAPKQVTRTAATAGAAAAPSWSQKVGKAASTPAKETGDGAGEAPRTAAAVNGSAPAESRMASGSEPAASSWRGSAVARGQSAAPEREAADEKATPAAGRREAAAEDRATGDKSANPTPGGESGTATPQGPRSWAERMKTNAGRPPAAVSSSPSTSRRSSANLASSAAPAAPGWQSSRGAAAAVGTGSTVSKSAATGGSRRGSGSKADTRAPAETASQAVAPAQASAQVADMKKEQAASQEAAGKQSAWPVRPAPATVAAATGATPAAAAQKSQAVAVEKETAREEIDARGAPEADESKQVARTTEADKERLSSQASAGAAADAAQAQQGAAEEAAAAAAATSGPMTWAQRARLVKEKPAPVVEAPKPAAAAVSESHAAEGRSAAAAAGKLGEPHKRVERAGSAAGAVRGGPQAGGFADRAGHHRRENHRSSRGEAGAAEGAAFGGPQGRAVAQRHHGKGAADSAAAGEAAQAPSGQESGSRRSDSVSGGSGETPKALESACAAQRPSSTACYAAVVASSQPVAPEAQAPQRRWGPQAQQQPAAKPAPPAAEDALSQAAGAEKGSAGAAVSPGEAGAAAQPKAQAAVSEVAAAPAKPTAEEEARVLWPRNRPKLKKVVVEQEEEKEVPLLPGQEQKFALPQGRKDQLRAEERRRAKQQAQKQQDAEDTDELSGSTQTPTTTSTLDAPAKATAAAGVLSGSSAAAAPAPVAAVSISARDFPGAAAEAAPAAAEPQKLSASMPIIIEPRAAIHGFAVPGVKKETAAAAAPRVVLSKVTGVPPVGQAFTEPPPPLDALEERAVAKEEAKKPVEEERRGSGAPSPRDPAEGETRKEASLRVGESPKGRSSRRSSIASTGGEGVHGARETKRESLLSPRANVGEGRSACSSRKKMRGRGSRSPSAHSPARLPEGVDARQQEEPRALARSPRGHRQRLAAAVPPPPPPTSSSSGLSPTASDAPSSPSHFAPTSAASPQSLAHTLPVDDGASSPVPSPSNRGVAFSPSASLSSDVSPVSAADKLQGDSPLAAATSVYSGPYSKRLLVAYRLSRRAAAVPALISISALSHPAAMQQIQQGGEFWHHSQGGGHGGDDSWKSSRGSGRAGDGPLLSMHRKNEGKRGGGVMGGAQGASGRNEDGWRNLDAGGSGGRAQGDGGRGGAGGMRDWRRGDDSTRSGGVNAMMGGLGGFFNQERPDAGEFRRMQQSLPPPPTHAIFKASECSWVKKQAEQKKDEQQQLLRRLKGYLNKLTLEKFEKLYPQILGAGIKEKEEVNALMKMVFEKAVSQHHFIQMYVQLCSRLKDDLKQILADDAKGSYFRRILINQCEDSFVANLEPMRVPEGLGEEEAFEFAQLYKARMKGNMIFVGELLKSRMISHRILLECIDRLLQKRLECIEISSGEDQGVPHMEALCAFLHTVGPFFENPKWKYYEEFCERIKTVQKLQKDESLPFRVRCLLKDVLDNRAEKWRKKFAASKEGPTRLSELHQQAQLEQLQQQYMSDSRGILGGGKGRGYDGRSGLDDGGWEMAPSRRGLGGLSRMQKPGVGTPVTANSRGMGGGDNSKPMSAFSALGRMRSEREKEREPRRDDNLRRENWGSSLNKKSSTLSSLAHGPSSPTAESSAAGSSSSSHASLLGRAIAEAPRAREGASRSAPSAESAAASKENASVSHMSEEKQIAAARSELKDLVQSMDLDTALQMLEEMNLSPSVHKAVFDEWLKYAIEALVADKEHVNKQRALAFQLFVQVCQRRILQAEALKACLKQFMSGGSDEDEEDMGEDSLYQDMKIDVPRLGEFMKELLQTIQTVDAKREVLSTSTLDDLRGKL
ncbi:MIF4G domain-containing protein [Besnoitia besnoiti]|uniref:MIF4G domain-containing protein n=1 Tax=Besnoitia besnoiti TaxID=94643 RepID=A0A2A9MCI6_BESBE|nr:MIF4G domain-containing protein [Besnoitia besnoiti]PFH35589.1 MIF4G domain-containing protein [Besnoitia besnoiti]